MVSVALTMGTIPGMKVFLLQLVYTKTIAILDYYSKECEGDVPDCWGGSDGLCITDMELNIYSDLLYFMHSQFQNDPSKIRKGFI